MGWTPLDGIDVPRWTMTTAELTAPAVVVPAFGSAGARDPALLALERQLLSAYDFMADQYEFDIEGIQPVLHYVTFTLRRNCLLRFARRSCRAAVALSSVQ